MNRLFLNSCNFVELKYFIVMYYAFRAQKNKIEAAFCMSGNMRVFVRNTYVRQYVRMKKLRFSFVSQKIELILIQLLTYIKFLHLVLF